MAVGIRPNVGLAEDSRARASSAASWSTIIWSLRIPTILAVGECVRAQRQVYGLVAPLWEMCRALADRLTEQPSGYQGSVTSTKLKVSGIDVFSAGDFSGGDGAEDIVLRDAARGVYKRVIVQRRPASSARCSMAIPPTATGISTC